MQVKSRGWSVSCVSCVVRRKHLAARAPGFPSGLSAGPHGSSVQRLTAPPWLGCLREAGPAHAWRAGPSSFFSPHVSLRELDSTPQVGSQAHSPQGLPLSWPGRYTTGWIAWWVSTQEGHLGPSHLCPHTEGPKYQLYKSTSNSQVWTAFGSGQASCVRLCFHCPKASIIYWSLMCIEHVLCAKP